MTETKRVLLRNGPAAGLVVTLYEKSSHAVVHRLGLGGEVEEHIYAQTPDTERSDDGELACFNHQPD